MGSAAIQPQTLFGITDIEFNPETGVEIRWVRSVSMYRPVLKSINGQARPWAAGVFRTRYNFGNYILDWTSGGGACHVSSRRLWQRLLSSGQRCPSPLRCLLQVVLCQFGPAVGTIVRRRGHASALPAGSGVSACSTARVLFRWFWPARFCQAVGCAWHLRASTATLAPSRTDNAHPCGLGTHSLSPVGRRDNNE